MLFCGAVIPSQAEARSKAKEAKEVSLDAPNKLTVKVRTQAPYDAEIPLQVVCYFKRKESGDKTLGAAVERGIFPVACADWHLEPGWLATPGTEGIRLPMPPGGEAEEGSR